MEDIDHRFFSSEFFLKIWSGISNWLGFSTVRIAHVVDHFLQFENLGGFSKIICANFQLIWLTCVWVIWCGRNARVFRRANPRYRARVRRSRAHSCRGPIFL